MFEEPVHQFIHSVSLSSLAPILKSMISPYVLGKFGQKTIYMAILPPLKSKSTSKFVELISPAELVLLIDER